MDPLLSLVYGERFDRLSPSSREAVSACNATDSETIDLESELAIFCREGYLPFAGAGMGSWVQTTITPQAGPIRPLFVYSGYLSAKLFCDYNDLVLLRRLKEESAFNADRFIHAIRKEVHIIPAVMSVLREIIRLTLSLSTVLTTRTIHAKDLQAVMAYTNSVVDIHRLDRNLRDLTGMGFLEGLIRVTESKVLAIAYALRESDFKKKISRILNEVARLQAIVLVAYANSKTLLSILEQLGYTECSYPSGAFSVVKPNHYTAPRRDVEFCKDAFVTASMSVYNIQVLNSACYDVGVNDQDFFGDQLIRHQEVKLSSHGFHLASILPAINHEINSEIFSETDLLNPKGKKPLVVSTCQRDDDVISMFSAPSFSTWSKEEGTKFIEEHGPEALFDLVKTGIGLLKKKFLSSDHTAISPSAVSSEISPIQSYFNGSVIPFGGYLN